MKNKDYQIERLKQKEFIKEPKQKDKFENSLYQDNRYIEFLIKSQYKE